MWMHLDSLGLTWISLGLVWMHLNSFGLTWANSDSLVLAWTHLNILDLICIHQKSQHEVRDASDSRHACPTGNNFPVTRGPAEAELTQSPLRHYRNAFCFMVTQMAQQQSGKAPGKPAATIHPHSPLGRPEPHPVIAVDAVRPKNIFKEVFWLNLKQLHPYIRCFRVY